MGVTPVGSVSIGDPMTVAALKAYEEAYQRTHSVVTPMSTKELIKNAGRDVIILAPTSDDPIRKGLATDIELSNKASDRTSNIKEVVIYGDISPELAIENLRRFFESIKSDRRPLLFDASKLYKLKDLELNSDVSQVFQELLTERGYVPSEIEAPVEPLQKIEC